MSIMKKSIVTLLIATAFAASSSTASAGWFGAKFGTTPSLTLFGQTLTVPVPSIVLGSAAGTTVSGSASTSGVSVTLPFIKVGVKTPKLTVGLPSAKLDVTTGGIKKASAGDAKKKRTKKKK